MEEIAPRARNEETMAIERTLLIIKPDAVRAGNAGKILAMLEGDGGFRVRALRMEHLTQDSARRFYEVHRERPFYGDLVEFMTSGSCIPLVLEREDAISHLRDFIGATDPAKARPGTVRALYATDVQHNAVHASDSPESAAVEIPHFFPEIAVAVG
jgi:nucleoside-diphosphate kinase